MTAKCGGGTSAPRPGAAQQNVVAGALITEGLILLSPWLIPFAALIDGFLFEATSQCVTDPPAMPVWDQSDALALVGGLLNPNIQQPLTKAQNLLLNFAWDRFCTCTSGALIPAVPVPPPTGVTNVTGTPTQPCFVGNYVGRSVQLPPASNESLWQDITQQLLSTTGVTHTITDTSGSYSIWGIPSNTTSLNLQEHGPASQTCISPPTNVETFLRFYDSTFTVTTQYQIELLGTPASLDIHATIPVPASSVWWRMSTAFSPGACGLPTEDMRIQTQVWCGGGGNNIFAGCCPGPADLSIGIQNIIKLIQNLPTSSGGALRAYTKGTVHTSVTGTTSFTVSGIVGMLIDVTTGTPTTPQLGGNPPYEWNLGFLSVSTTDGMIQQRRLTRQHMLWFPDQMQIFTIIGLFLNAGVVVNVTELHSA